MLGFSVEELEIIQAIRDLLQDESIDEYDCLNTYEEILG